MFGWFSKKRNRRYVTYTKRRNFALPYINFFRFQPGQKVKKSLHRFSLWPFTC